MNQEQNKNPIHCRNKCYLFDCSRGCLELCNKQYGHVGPCMCGGSHICKERCILCNNYCCKEAKHVNEHLCHYSQHACNEMCEEHGFCAIFIQTEKKERMKENKTKEYEMIRIPIGRKNKCQKLIPFGELKHSGNHSCGLDNHYCGFKCNQCEFYCILPYGHLDLHNCHHGNIRNLPIILSNNSIKKDEEAKLISCDIFCREKGQEHMHYFESDIKINNGEVKLCKEIDNKYIYECKCSYFWKNILKFKNNFIINK